MNTPQPSPAQPSPAQPSPAQPSLAVHAIIDQQHGLPAAAINYPAQWQAQSWVAWNFNHGAQPVKMGARVIDPQTATVVELFPLESFCWIEPNVMGYCQPGRETGDGQVFMPPASAAEAMLRWVIPRYRGQMRGLRVAGTGAMPGLAATMKMPDAPGAMREGVNALIEYDEGGMQWEEQFFGLKVAYQGVPSYGTAGTLVQYNWGFERLFSFRAPKGRLSANRNVGWDIMRSVRVNPAWTRIYEQILQALQQRHQQQLDAGYANIAAATQLSHQISAQNDAFLARQEQQRNDAYRSDQQRRATSGSTYSTNDAFGDMMMGRETVDDPNDPMGYSQHSGYHDHIWTNVNGEVIATDDPNLDPNVGSNQTWTETRKKQLGDPW